VAVPFSRLTLDIAHIDRLLSVAYGAPVNDRGPAWAVDVDALWDQRAALAAIRDRGFTVVDKRKVR
jgi:hypothetical protein